MRVCTIAEIDERTPRVSSLLDRFSRGLMKVTPSSSGQDTDYQYFKYVVGFLHRTVRDYIVITRQVQIQERILEFDAKPKKLTRPTCYPDFLNKLTRLLQDMLNLSSLLMNIRTMKKKSSMGVHSGSIFRNQTLDNSSIRLSTLFPS